jgi:MFS family permease
MEIAIIATMFFVGIGIGAAVNSALTNKFGRKFMLLF